MPVCLEDGISSAVISLCGRGVEHHINLNTLRLRQNGHHFPDHRFKHMFLIENCCILIRFEKRGPICNDMPALVQIMAWHRTGYKPLFWTNDGLFSWWVYASLNLSELSDMCSLYHLNNMLERRTSQSFIFVMIIFHISCGIALRWLACDLIDELTSVQVMHCQHQCCLILLCGIFRGSWGNMQVISQVVMEILCHWFFILSQH